MAAASACQCVESQNFSDPPPVTTTIRLRGCPDQDSAGCGPCPDVTAHRRLSGRLRVLAHNSPAGSAMICRPSTYHSRGAARTCESAAVDSGQQRAPAPDGLMQVKWRLPRNRRGGERAVAEGSTTRSGGQGRKTNRRARRWRLGISSGDFSSGPPRSTSQSRPGRQRHGGGGDDTGGLRASFRLTPVVKPDDIEPREAWKTWKTGNSCGSSSRLIRTWKLPRLLPRARRRTCLTSPARDAASRWSASVGTIERVHLFRDSLEMLARWSRCPSTRPTSSAGHAVS